MGETARTYRIGEVAAEVGATVEALRYYERLGLLPRPPRTGGGLRRYGPEILHRVRFIKQAQTLGLTLREIQQLLGHTRRPSRAGCQRVHDVLVQHIADVDRQMIELRALRRTLADHLKTCEQALGVDADPCCPTLDALERPTNR